jgi:hypothetical protein
MVLLGGGYRMQDTLQAFGTCNVPLECSRKYEIKAFQATLLAEDVHVISSADQQTGLGLTSRHHVRRATAALEL